MSVSAAYLASEDTLLLWLVGAGDLWLGGLGGGETIYLPYHVQYYQPGS